MTGPKGEDGQSLYTWLKYADTPTSGMNDNPTGKAYIGLAYNKTTATESTNYSDYTWSLVKGTDGQPGPPGANGESLFTWIKYADSPTSGMSDLSAGKPYIGLAYNKPSSVESSNYADYTWSLIKGEKGDKGDTGPRGATGSQGPRGNDGTSVTGATEYYLATAAGSGVTTSTSGWDTTMQPMDTTKKYLWNYEKIHFSDGTSQDTLPVIVGVHGATGSQGPKGEEGDVGRSITSITEHYLATSAASGVTRSTDGWKPTMQPTSDAARYLWNYETITWNKAPLTTYVEPIIIGVHGQKGDQGPQGPQGLRGPTGANGKTLYTWLKYADTPTTGMNDNPTGKAYIGLAYNKETATESTNYADYTWSLVKGTDGQPGPPGSNGESLFTWIKYADTPTSGMNDSPIGKAYIGLAYNKETASESTNYSDYTWSLIKGEKGDPGPQGPQGVQGIQGPQGPKGTSQYIHIRYSKNANGNPMTTTPQSDTAYIGIVNSTSATAPTGYASYTWSKYRGDNGSQGVQGPPGANGVTTYTWVKFADTNTGVGMNDSPAGKKYIGLAFNKTTQTESTTASQYTWSLMPQNIEVGAKNLLRLSGQTVTNNSNPTNRYDLTEKMVAGQIYTLRVWGTLGTGKTSFNPYLNGGSISLGAMKNNGDGTFTLTFGGKDSGVTTGDFLNIYPMPNTVTTASTITKIKLEKGDIATDWTEAPEDVEARIGGKADQAQVDAIAGNLEDKVEVSDWKTQQEAYEEWLQSIQVQAENAKTLAEAVDNALATINTNLQKQAEKWITLDGYVQIDGATNTFTISNKNTSSKIVMDASKMIFYDRNTPVATVTSQYLYINRGIFARSAQIGRHKFEPLESDNDFFVLTYVGE